MGEFKVGDKYEILHVFQLMLNGKVGDIITADWITDGGTVWGYTNKGRAIELNNTNYYKLKKLEENMYKVGDMVKNENVERKVLAVCGELTALSYDNDFKNYSGWWTKHDLRNYKLKDSQVELSMDEIASKFNVDVKDLKIKKES